MMDFKKIPIDRLIELAKIGKRYERKEKNIVFPNLEDQLNNLQNEFREFERLIKELNEQKTKPYHENMCGRFTAEEHWINELNKKTYIYFNLGDKVNKEKSILKEEIELLIKVLDRYK